MLNLECGERLVGRTDKLAEWRSGGSMLAATTVCCGFSVFPVNILGALINALEGAYGWSRAAITSAVLITAIGTVLVGPLAGNAADRLGPRRVVLVTLPLLSVAVALIGLAGPSLRTWYAAWAVFAIAQACAGNIIWTKAVVGRFDENRGLALGVMLSGSALAHGLLPGFAVLVMSAWSWRMTYFILAAATLVVGWPLTWRYFHGARDLELPQAGPGGVKPQTSAPFPPPKGLLRRQLRTRQFWQMAASFFIVGSAVATLYVHFLPILIDAGFSTKAAATAALVLGPAAIIGRLSGGFLLDRFPPQHVVAVALVLPAISYAALMFGGTSLPAVYACALLMGLVLGAEADFMAYLASRYFGQQSFGSLYGVLLGIFAVGYGIGPFLAGRLYDVTKSYHSSFIVFTCATLVGSLLIARLGPAPHR